MEQEPKKPRSERGELELFVRRRVKGLQKAFLSQGERTRVAGTLAMLRRVAAKRPNQVGETYAVEFEGLPESLSGVGNEPATAGEWAAHLALTLYATHQQSQSSEMHKDSDTRNGEFYGIGHAVRRLSNKGGGEQVEPGQMPSRFAAMVTAELIGEVAHYARQLVTQLRSEGIPLDYARLAGQFYDFQNPYRRDSVRLAWGREFASEIRTIKGATDNDVN